jgi:hypothetical protein
MALQKNLSRILDYEFLGIFCPEHNSTLEFLHYQIIMEDQTTGLCFFPFKDNIVLHKGDVVEYYEKAPGKLVVSLPKKKKIFVNHSNE